MANVPCTRTIMAYQNGEVERMIRVDGINRLINDETFYELFSNIGLVDSVSLHFNRGAKCGYALVVFNRDYDAMRAPSLNGAVRCNTTLQIRYQGDYATLDAPHNALESDSNDRKNLYVLNIPLDMTSDEFRDLFVPFGTVTHAVILAMLDSSSRRRGFVDMLTPQEAAEALNTLNGANIRSYTIEVSYALVQRSGELCKALRCCCSLTTTQVNDHAKPNRPVKHRVPVLSSRAKQEPASVPSNANAFPLGTRKLFMEGDFASDMMSRSYSQPQAEPNHSFNQYVSAFAPHASVTPVPFAGEAVSQDFLAFASTPFYTSQDNRICLVIKNLPISHVKSDSGLRLFIQSFGPVESFIGKMFALPDSNVASAIVTFVSPSDAALVMFGMNGKYIGGNKIEVSHTTNSNSPNKMRDITWNTGTTVGASPTFQQRRFISEQQPLKIPTATEAPRYFSAPHDRFTFQPVPHIKPTAAIGEERNSSNSSLESLLDRVNLDDSKHRRHPLSPETGESSFNDNSVSTNEVATPSSASRHFNIQSSPLSEVSMFKTGAGPDKENFPIINRQSQRFTID
ncbi:hypothetical protein E3P99_02315 [Wallemia hederae]|uniref:RRM domain-containing protein n=1 Tax=Wallemia hederae TaxID=1540922 RepID=A0A4T0FLG0_9BASI|nr:hypothetical protein E3P99_02315 [Wallemia hederae]